MEKYYAHVLSNTHWDREWYMSHEKYLVRLVSLMDRLMDILAKDPSYIFITDGQFSMVDDYLQNRPERTEELKKYVKEGRLRVGPWFTQPLETLVSGEAMIRNLHYGIAGSEALGDAMRFSYEVDEFGHASQTGDYHQGQKNYVDNSKVFHENRLVVADNRGTRIGHAFKNSGIDAC